jgi:hypothetical protein
MRRRCAWTAPPPEKLSNFLVLGDDHPVVVP